MADEEVEAWPLQSRLDEELEFFTELALQETQRWIETVTRKRFAHQDDVRASLENGVLLCELLNGMKPGTVRKINRLPSPIAGLDNINIFLEACRNHFGLKDSQLFHSCDLEDLSQRAISDCEGQLKHETDRRLRSVAITIFWLGKFSKKTYTGPQLDLTAFTDLVGGSAFSTRSSIKSPSVLSVDSLPPSLTSSVGRSPSVLSDDSAFHQTPRSVRENAELFSRQSDDSPTHSHSSYQGVQRRGGGGGGSVLGGDSDSYSKQISVDSCLPDRHVVINGKGSEDTESVFSDRSSVSGSISSPSDLYTRDIRLLSKLPAGGGTSGCKPQEYANEEAVTKVTQEDIPCSSGDVPPSTANHSTAMPGIYDARNISYGSRPPPSSTSSNASSPRYPASVDSNYDEDDNNVLETREAAAKADNYNRFRYGEAAAAPPPTSQDAPERPQYRRSTTLPSTTSAPPANPLQFVKASGDGMAQKAKETVEVMKKQKHVKTTIQSEEEDWQSNLSSWKTRRKSAASYKGPLELEEEEETGPKRKNKTFKEMMAARDGRKSGGIIGYSLDGDEEESSPRDKSATLSGSYGTKAAHEEDALSAFGFQKADDDNKSNLSSLNTSTASEDHLATTDHGDGEKPVVVKAVEEKKPEKRKPWELPKVRSVLPPPSPRKSDMHQGWTPKSSSHDDQRQHHSPNSAASGGGMKNHSDSSPSSSRNSVQKSFSVSSSDAYANNHNGKSGSGSRGDVSSPTFSASRGLFQKSNTVDVTTRSHASTTKHSPVGRGSWMGEDQELEQSHKQSDQKNFIEKSIRISQKPNHDKGFGFTIRGGKEHRTPVRVEKVVLGGSADVCELMPGDEILAINGVEVASHYQESVQLVINKAVQAGQIDLKIKRCFDKAQLGGFDEEEMLYEKEHQLLKQEQRKMEMKVTPTPSPSHTPSSPSYPQHPTPQSLNPSLAPTQPRHDPYSLTVSEPWVTRDQSPHRSPQLGSKSDDIGGKQSQGISPQAHALFDSVSPARSPVPRWGESDTRGNGNLEPQKLEEDLIEELKRDEQEENRQMEEQRREKQRREEQRKEEQRRKEQQKEEQWREEQQRKEQRRKEEQRMEEEKRQDEERKWEEQRRQQEQRRKEEVVIQHQNPVYGQPPSSYPDQSDEEDDDDAPPPLPSAPPPPPNWSTFPSAGPPGHSDLLPDQASASPQVEMRARSETPEDVRAELLRRKSEFLGLGNMKESEEYYNVKKAQEEEEKIRAEQEQKKKDEVKNMERTSVLSKLNAEDTELVHSKHTHQTHTEESSWQSSHKHRDFNYNERKPVLASPSNNISSFGGGQYELEEEERKIIANLEREEAMRNRSLDDDRFNRADEGDPRWSRNAAATQGEDGRRRPEPLPASWREASPQGEQVSSPNKDKMRAWKSMEFLRPQISQVVDIDIESRVSRDMESLYQNQAKPVIQTSHRFLDLEAERKRMEAWGAEQEKLRQADRMPLHHHSDTYPYTQDAFERDQVALQQRLKSDMQQATRKGEEQRKQEDKLLERELTHQKQVEATRQNQTDRQRRLLASGGLTTGSLPSLAKWEDERALEERDAERTRLEDDRQRQLKEQEQLQLLREEHRLRQHDIDAEQRRLEEERRRDEEQRRRREEDEQRREDERRQREAEDRKRREEHETKHWREREAELQRKEAQLKSEEERIRLLRKQQELDQVIPVKPGYDPVDIEPPPAFAYNPQGASLYDNDNSQKSDLDTVVQVGVSTNVDHSSNAEYVSHKERDRKSLGAPPPPPAKKPISKKEPAIPPKPSLKAELQSNRKHYTESNSRVAMSVKRSSVEGGSQVQTKSSMERVSISSTEIPGQNGDDEIPTRPMTREEVMMMNRKVVKPRDSPFRETTPPSQPQPQQQDPLMVPHSSMSKRSLHSLNQVPRPRYNEKSWLQQDASSKAAVKRSDIMRQTHSTSEHWLVEEAERRRVAENSGTERPPNHSRQGSADIYSAYAQGYGVPPGGVREYTPTRESLPYGVPPMMVPGQSPPRNRSPPKSSFSYSQKQTNMSTFRPPGHVTEVDMPEFDYNGSISRPIPESIKQSLIERVVHPSPRGPHGAPPTSPPYNHNPHTTSSHIPPPPQFDPHYQSNPHGAPYTENIPYHQPRTHNYTQQQQQQQQQHGNQQQHPHGIHQSPQLQMRTDRPASISSGQSWEPPVPPKPPRLLSAASDERHAEQVVSVSGNRRCSHCDRELGQGAAMILESLQLYYHVQCFRCSVCQVMLSNGRMGADVRVRLSKLHCQNCYSNEEAGLKFSRV